MFRPFKKKPKAPIQASKPAPAPTDGPSVVWRIPQTMQIQGKVSAQIDIAIDGGLDGDVLLADHRLFLGAKGQLNGDVRAKSVLVRGTVHGDITAADLVTITRTGSVQGNIRARRVRLADGCSVRGRVHQGPTTSV